MGGGGATEQKVKATEGLEETIRAFLSKELSSFKVREIDVKPGHDHDGDPVVHVYVHHTLVDKPLNLREVLAANSKLRDLVWRKGESRFVHIRHLYDEKQKVAS